MNKKPTQTIVINGRRYDAHSGKALGQPAIAPQIKPAELPQKRSVISDIARPAPQPAHPRTTVTARAVHATTQKSTTLRREHLAKPASHRPAPTKRTYHVVERSHHISHFTQPIAPEPKPKAEPDHELIRQQQELRAHHARHVAHQQRTVHKTSMNSRAVKEHLLAKTLADAPVIPLEASYQEAGQISRRARLFSVLSTSLALVLLGGYLTYINIPNLSIRVAAANAGINATLPQYQPSGYRLHGPIAYSSGEVEVSYRQNGGNLGYNITQRASDWDPEATLDNYVKPDSNDNYEIHSVQGLTVYTYDKKAVWVNDGILHVIDGSAPLSGQAVEQIAASM